MNGVSVYPGPKTQNAPTWQVEKQAGRRPISAVSGSGNTVPTPPEIIPTV